MKKFGIATLTAFVAVLVITCSKSGATPEEQLLSQTPNPDRKVQINTSQMEDDLLSLINEHRASLGAKALLDSPETYKHAEDHNEYMISQNKLSHDNFDSRATKIAAETNAVSIGENVARHYDTAATALEGWLSSSSHKSTLEGSYTHTALSISLDKEGKPYFTQIFITLE
ncbi:CAP domain-containing protein [Flagellimonas allohymeniacidonis]|uniref:CAP domain-containing protein n=1 Tax=Flagellimonas allohymeniacidonis TaxID=2517819 RepID=A0A4Q8QH63_9FLAO|nr:CAP domain-containing protein [Allomuricauda hymeniacidonis]TAI47749.1 CAP domain-containing protein [Allomuricauda hymeniacidonis]